jgi:hypothetical protein
LWEEGFQQKMKSGLMMASDMPQQYAEIILIQVSRMHNDHKNCSFSYEMTVYPLINQ